MPISPFADLRDFYDPALVLPVAGKEYRIPAPSANETLRIRRFFVDPEAELTEEEHVVELLKILGSEVNPETGAIVGGVAAEMDADGAGFDDVVHVGATALIHFAVGPGPALAFWSNASIEPAPAEPAPARKAAAPRKAPAKRAPAKKAAPAKRAGK